MGLLIVGLMMGLVALTLVELGAASDNPRSQASLETMFYAGGRHVRRGRCDLPHSSDDRPPPCLNPGAATIRRIAKRTGLTLRRTRSILGSCRVGTRWGASGSTWGRP
jgi:hypothetical protein